MIIFRRFFGWVKKRRVFKMAFPKALLAAAFLNLGFGVAFYFVEKDVQQNLTLMDSLWWSMVTMTTVGYGDYYAQTNLGRYLISYPCMLVGIGIIGFFVSTVAENVLQRTSQKRKGLVKIKESGHVIFCHYPSAQKILQLIKELRGNVEYENCSFVLISDDLDEIPEVLRLQGVQFVKGDPTQEDILLKANIFESAGVFVLSRREEGKASDAKTIAMCAILDLMERDSDKKIHVVAELTNKNNEKMLKRANVDGIVTSEGISDCLMVQEFLYPGVNEIIQDIISNSNGSQFYIFETRLIGFRISDIQIAVIEHPANLQVIGIIKKGQFLLNPSKMITIESDDKLILLADDREDFESIEEDILKKKSASTEQKI